MPMRLYTVEKVDSNGAKTNMNKKDVPFVIPESMNLGTVHAGVLWDNPLLIYSQSGIINQGKTSKSQTLLIDDYQVIRVDDLKNSKGVYLIVHHEHYFFVFSVTSNWFQWSIY